MMKHKAMTVAIATLLGAAIALAASSFVPSQQPFGYIAPAAFSGSDVGDSPVAYVPRFEYGTYNGDLIAANVLANGQIDLLSPLWRAAAVLDTQDWEDERFIVTRDLDGLTVPFTKDDLSDDQVDLLKPKEKDRIKFLRGDRKKEDKNFRVRKSVLGDIIHSNPVYVGPSIRAYNFDDYAAFAQANETRLGRIYVGANDGMLHAFDAATGAETFAYIPSMLIPTIGRVAEETYVHEYMVDGPLTVEDAYFGGAWSTVLVGTLGAGGKGVFALDVTSDAPVVDESNTASGAGSKVMWEFSPGSSGGTNLGYTYASARIAKLNSGAWAAVIGNGYLSGSGAASLYVLDIATGNVIRELVVPDADANGLSTPTLIDTNADAKADYAYAGDLNGNVWRFDLTSSNPLDWGLSFNGEPLFQATIAPGVNQPITTAIDVARHPIQGFMVYFATGRLLSNEDAEVTTEQAVYGIWDNEWDNGALPIDTTELLDQTMRTTTHANGKRVRTATTYVPDWSTHKGWRLSLEVDGSYYGERVIQDISLSNGRVNVSSMNPTLVSGENWLLQINAVTGGAPDRVAFDINGDGLFDVADNVDGNGDTEITLAAGDRVMGLYKGFGIISRTIEARISGGSDAAITNQLSGTNPVYSTPTTPEEEPGGDDYGLVGGHMDLDVASQTYPIGNGKTDKHDHEWDNDYGPIADFMEIDTMGGFRAVDTTDDLPGSDDDRLFIVNVVNAGLSPGGVLEINGVDFPVVEWQAKVRRFLTNTMGTDEYFPVFKLDVPTVTEKAKGILQLTSLKMKFASDTILVGGLHPSVTGCVKSNHASPNGEYRNGALTTQLLDASGLTYTGGAANPASLVHDMPNNRYDAGSFAIHDTLNYAVPPAGTTHGPNDGLFWEAILFWHWSGGCYNIERIDQYRIKFYDETGVEDTRTHDGVPTGNYDDPYDDSDPTDDPGPAPEQDREENTEHTTSTDILSSVGSSGRLYWREWIPDNL